jgi:UrcA family protein
MMIILAAASVGSWGLAVHAREPVGNEDKGIIVEAPRNLPPPPERSPYSGAPVVTFTVRISALYGDLDLARSADAARLMTRIANVAHDACRYLDRLYPLSPDSDCVERAIDRATPAAQALIAAAAK